MTDFANMKEAVSHIIDYLRPIIVPLQNYRWSDRDAEQSWEFVQRGTVVRQFEAMQAISGMVENGYGHFGVTLLRPAFEELVWIEYLQKFPEIRAELTTLMIRNEVAKTLKAQKDYLGNKTMRSLGFSRQGVDNLINHAEGEVRRLRTIGQKLGWQRDKTSPSMEHVAKKVGRKSQYNFIYHASSRFVHYSPSEISRRVWGKQGDVKISSETFSSYWCDFALYWSTWIFLNTVIASDIDDVSLGEVGGDPDTVLQAVEALRPIQIITASELESWDRPRARHI